METSTRYQPNETEEKWYKHWKDSGYFFSKPDEREPFSVVIPPPNVTGVLHMGHILNNTIQDVLVRKARMEGKNACWVPGTDHASIATEAKVVRWLRDEKKIKKGDLTREQFMEYAWQWTEKYGGIILHQLEKLGASCDWSRTAFTMDEIRSEAVYKVFVDLFRKGKLYRDYRIDVYKRQGMSTGNWKTDKSNIYSFGHGQDEYAIQQEIWDSLGLKKYGKTVNINQVNYPYNNSHQLITSANVPVGDRHFCTILDNRTILQNGIPLFEPVWKYLLDVPLISTAVTSKKIEITIKIYPNPLKTGEKLQIEHKQDTEFLLLNIAGVKVQSLSLIHI